MNLVSIGSDNGLSPIRHQAIIWTNAGIFLIEPLGTKFSEIPIEIHTFSFNKMHLKMPSAKMAAILSRGRWVNTADDLAPCCTQEIGTFPIYVKEEISPPSQCGTCLIHSTGNFNNLSGPGRGHQRSHYLFMTWTYFPHYWPFVLGNHWLPVDSQHKGPVMEIWCFVCGCFFFDK